MTGPEIIYSRSNPDTTVSPGPQRVTLMSMAQDVLARLNMVAADMGIELPQRQMVYPTGVPADCEQVTVLIGGWQGTPTTDGMLLCQTFRWCAQIGVLISRCTPATPTRNSASAPPPDRMNAAAQIASDDAELLLALVSTFGEVGADLQLSTPEPEGGYQAVMLTVVLPAFGGLD